MARRSSGRPQQRRLHTVAAHIIATSKTRQRTQPCTTAAAAARTSGARGAASVTTAASTSQGLARENPDQGVFTAGILKGMKGGADRNADTIITVEELKNFVTDYVTDETNGAQKVNAPLVKAGVDFTLGFVSGG